MGAADESEMPTASFDGPPSIIIRGGHALGSNEKAVLQHHQDEVVNKGLGDVVRNKMKKMGLYDDAFVDATPSQSSTPRGSSATPIKGWGERNG